MQRPAANEYPIYCQYAINLVGQDVLLHLRQRQGLVADFYKSISEEKSLYAYEAGKWTIRELMGHIIDTERILAYRVLAFARGEQASLPGFDENSYVRAARFNERNLQNLLEEFLLVRASTIALVEHLPPDLHSLAGQANGHHFSVSGLCALIAGHEHHHSNVVAERYL